MDVIISFVTRWVPLRYEVVGLYGGQRSPAGELIWVGRGFLGLVSGFYLTERGARQGAKKCPDGFTPVLFKMPKNAAVKEELPL